MQFDQDNSHLRDEDDDDLKKDPASYFVYFLERDILGVVANSWIKFCQLNG